MAPNEEERPAEEVIVDIGAKVGSELPPDTGSKVVNPIDPNKIADVLIEHPEAMDSAVDHLANNKEAIRALLEKLIQDRTMMQKTISFGKALAIAGISLTASVVSGIIIGANLGAISAGLGAMGAGLAIAGPTIGFALAGLAGLVAIAALAFAAYKYRGQIKSGAEDIGKKVKDLLKDILAKLPLGLTNAQEFYANVINEDAQNELNPQGNPLSDNAAFVGQYLSEDGLAALKVYIENNKDENGEITLPDGSKLTVGDLNELETKSKGYFGIGKDEFRKVLKKFAPIMHKDNITLRTEIEKIQDAIHEGKNRQTPLPSSPLRPGSVANNELLALVSDDRRKVVKDLLQSIAGKGPELKGGLNADYRKQVNLIGNLEGEEAATAVTTLVDQVNNLSEVDFKNWIEDLNDRVSQLKVEQAKTPRTKVEETKPPQQTQSLDESITP